MLRQLAEATSRLLAALWDSTENQQGVRRLEKRDIMPFWKMEELKNKAQANLI